MIKFSLIDEFFDACIGTYTLRSARFSAEKEVCYPFQTSFFIPIFQPMCHFRAETNVWFSCHASWLG